MKTSLRLAAGVAAALLALPALAGPPAQESEGKALQRVARSFGKLRSYAVTAQVEGGMAQGPDHRLSTYTVNTTYTALVHGPVCKVESPKPAFRARLGQGGAIQDGVRWMSMLATEDGRLMERLFPRPEAVLAECVRLKKAARWVQPAGQADTSAPPADAPTVDAEDVDEGGADGTTTRDQDDDDDGLESQAPASHHIRIEGPPTVALEHFIRIQNSGCFSEG